MAKFPNLEQLGRDPFITCEMTGGSIDETGQVGAHLYTTPYIEQGWLHIDSLGVVMFELWHPIVMAVERIMIISNQKNKGPLSPPWATDHSDQPARLQWKKFPNPSDRPQALQVLKNELQSSGSTYIFTLVISIIFVEERDFTKVQHYQSGRERVKADGLIYIYCRTSVSRLHS